MKTSLATFLRRLALGAGVALLAPVSVRADTIAAGRDFGGAIDSSGTLRTWGANTLGQLGQGTFTTSVSQPGLVSGSHTWSAIAMGTDFSLGIDTAGALWAWGNNASGQLGTGASTSASTPVRVATGASGLPTGATVSAVAAGQNFGLAIVNTAAAPGRLYAWGNASFGQLGQGNTTSHSTPVVVGTRSYSAIAATDVAAIAISADGKLWAWGDNSTGELGRGGTAGSPASLTTPTQIGTLTGWTKLAGGFGHVLALRGTELYAWGYNLHGEIGTGTTSLAVTTPTRIASTQSWSAVGAGDNASYAINTAGQLFGWGFNFNGQLDLPVSQVTNNANPSPQLIGNTETGFAPWTAIAGGADFMFALTTGGVVGAVGNNSVGQLGTGVADGSLNFSPSFGAVQVSGVTLGVTAPTVPATTLGVNSIAQPVTVTVQNSGSGTQTTSFLVSLYLSTDAVLDSGDTLLATSTQAAPLVGLASQTVTFVAPDVALPEVAPGTYRIISQVTPINPANPFSPANGAATTVTIAGPDLTVESLAVAGSHTVLASGTLSGTTATLRNGGTGAVAAGRTILVKAYLGTTTTHNPAADVLVDQFTFTTTASGLAAGAAIALPSRNITIPAGTVGGSYQLLYVINEDAAVTESGTLSDTAALTVAVQSHDLAVTAPTLPNIGTPADGGAKILGTGATIDVINVSAQNVGSQVFSAGFTVTLYLSTDTVLSADDLLLSSTTSGLSLAAAGSRLIQFTNLTIPASVAPGSYQLLARIDPAPGNNDAGPANNTAALPVRVHDPDFALSTAVLGGGSTVAAGGSFTGVTYTLRNLREGVLPVGTELLVQAWLSTSASFSPATATLLDQFTYTAGLAAGPSSVALPPSPHGSITVPAGTAGGAYNLFLVVNSDGALLESGSTDADPGTANNALAVPVTVSAADLAVTAPTSTTSSFGVNTNVGSISTFVQNQDALQAFTAGYTVELYLSADAAFSADDILLKTITQSAAINPVSSILLSWTNVAIPDVAPGNYFLLARVALPAGSTDRNTSNNVAATSITLVGPSLSLGSFVFPNTTSVGAGGSFGNVTYRLSNTGLGAVPFARDVSIEVFLSADGTLDRNADVLLDQYSFTAGLGSGASVTLPSPLHAINLPQNVLNGVYHLLFVVNGTGAVAGASVTVTDQQVAVGALDASVTAPALSGTSLGVNTTLPNSSVTVANLGGFSIPAGTVVKLYLSADSLVDLGDTLLTGGTQTISTVIPGGSTRSVTFTGLTVPDIGTGAFHLLAEITLPTGLIDLNLANNVADTPVTLLRPKLAINSVSASGTADLDATSPSFSAVTFSLSNTSLGEIPANTPVLLEVYLSSDGTLNPATDTLLVTRSFSSGLGGSATATASALIGPFNIPLNPNTVGGNYFLIFAANRDRAVQESDAIVATAARQVFLQKTNAPGLALDFGTFTFSSSSGTAQWFSVTDTRASDSTAFQSPTLSAGQTATLTLTVSGPTTLNAPWQIIGAAADKISYAIDNVTPANQTSGTLTVGETYQIVSLVAGDDFTNVGATSNTTAVVFTATGTTPSVWTNGSALSAAALTGFQPSYKPKLVTVPVGTHSVSWTYTQVSSLTTSFARLDLDLPSFSTSGDGSWFGATDASAPNGGSLKVARSPVLATGQQAALQVPVTGPAVVDFWWRADSVTASDTLGFFIDGQLAELPTTTFFTDPVQAVISGTTNWANVAFLIGSGTHTLSWVYSQNSTTTASAVFVDGLSVLSPVPATNTTNRTNTPATHAAVPPSNLDLAITDVVAPTGTYLLDDANGTGRLPVTITVADLGADFTSTALGSGLDAADLEIHLSTNRTFGDSDDIDLGNFANLNTELFGNEAVFDGEINLPFDIPSGDYFLLIRYAGQADTASAANAEFTLANNTRVLGPGYVIQRAPDLIIQNFQGLSANNPYHPEDPVFVQYTIANTGLGTVLPSQPFKVQLALMAIATTATDLTQGTVIKTYTPVAHSLFLPEVSGQHPNGGSATVTHFIDLPTLRDTLGALGLVATTIAEDDGTVAAKAPQLANFKFYFRTFVDSDNAITESSETNLQFHAATFSLTPVPTSLNAGQYFGQTLFSTLANATGGTSIGAATTAITFTASPPFAALIKDYALGKDLIGAPQTLFQPTAENGFPTLTVLPGGTDTYLTETFDFNIRANDVQIDVQSSPDLVTWTTLVSLTPPYSGTSGAHSLSGFGGLKDNPFVLAVDGNNTNVQATYVARVTVRDSTPTANSTSRFMRLNISPLATVSDPSGLTLVISAAFSSSLGAVVLTLPGALTSGAYVIERSVSASPTNFTIIGSTANSTSTDTVTTDTYTYRVRVVTAAGASATATASVTVP